MTNNTPSETEARELLAVAGYIQSAEAKAGPRGGARALTLNLGRVLAGEDGAEGDGDGPAGGLATPGGGIGDGIGDAPEVASSQVRGVGDVGDIGDATPAIEGASCRKCGTAVDPVAAAETGGWHLGCAPGPQDCPGCGRHVADGVREAFAGWHPTCAPDDIREAGLQTRDAARGAQEQLPAPEDPPAPAGAVSGAQEADGGSDDGDELDAQLVDFRRALHRVGREVSEDDARDALAAWHDATSGLRFREWAGVVGMAAYARLAARAGLDARGIATVATIDAPEVEAASTDLALHLDWLAPGLELDGGAVTELDVNGQFLSAAGIEMGTGVPEVVDKPRSLSVYRGRPGYVRLASPLVIPAGTLPHTAPAWAGIEAGRTLAMTSVDYLTKNGVSIDAEQVIWWPKSRRHLDAWQRFWRDARDVLTRRAAAGDDAARLALVVLKSVVTVFLGGMLRSDSSPDKFRRVDWSDAVIAEAWVRALVAVERAGREGAQVVGMRRDSAWFWTPGSDGPTTPAGVTLSSQLGKWKHSRWAAMDERIRDAYDGGSAETFNSAVKAAHEAREGSK